jgi:hypothetical protein
MKDYESAGAYKKNKLTRVVIDNAWCTVFSCDRCGKSPKELVTILRGGYVQEHLCKECDEKDVQETE